jgi:hypothetical protein
MTWDVESLGKAYGWALKRFLEEVWNDMNCGRSGIIIRVSAVQICPPLPMNQALRCAAIWFWLSFGSH